MAALLLRGNHGSTKTFWRLQISTDTINGYHYGHKRFQRTSSIRHKRIISIQRLQIGTKRFLPIRLTTFGQLRLSGGVGALFKVSRAFRIPWFDCYIAIQLGIINTRVYLANHYIDCCH